MPVVFGEIKCRFGYEIRPISILTKDNSSSEISLNFLKFEVQAAHPNRHILLRV